MAKTIAYPIDIIFTIFTTVLLDSLLLLNSLPIYLYVGSYSLIIPVLLFLSVSRGESGALDT